MQVNNALPINDGYLCRLGLDMSIINPKIEELNALLSLGDFDLTPGHLDQICACIVLGDLVSTTLANGTIEVVQTIDFDSGTSRNGNLRSAPVPRLPAILEGELCPVVPTALSTTHHLAGAGRVRKLHAVLHGEDLEHTQRIQTTTSLTTPSTTEPTAETSAGRSFAGPQRSPHACSWPFLQASIRDRCRTAAPASSESRCWAAR